MDEAPADLTASERFETIFGIERVGGRMAGDQAAGGSAIIAVKLASAASLSPT